MNLFEQLRTLEVHDSTLKSLTIAFEARSITIDVDLFQQQSEEYLTYRWSFHRVSGISLTNLESPFGDVEIFSLETRDVAKDAKQIMFQLLQGPGRPSATFSFTCGEATSKKVDMN